MAIISDKEFLNTICEKAKNFEDIRNSGKSDACIMVLELMDTDVFPNDYCGALDFVLKTFDNIDKSKLEQELDLYI